MVKVYPLGDRPMTRDTLNALITAILMVIGLIALNPEAVRGDRHSTSDACNLFSTCDPLPKLSDTEPSDVQPGEADPQHAPNASPEEGPTLLSHQ